MTQPSLGELLRNHSDSISSTWLERTAKLAPDRQPELREHLPSLLAELALALDATPGTDEVDAYRTDFELEAVTAELGLLRECVLDALDGAGASYGARHVRALAGAFSNALARAVSQQAERARVERQALDDEVRRNEAELRLVTDALPLLVSFVTKDERYTFVNKAYEDWFGIPREQVQGRTLLEVIGPAAYAVLGPYARRGLAGERFSFEQYDVPYKFGGKRDVRVWFVPHTTGQGEVNGYVALLQDITVRRQAELALERQSLERLLLLEEAQRAQAKEQVARQALEEALTTADRLNAQLGEAELILRNLVNNLPELAWSAAPNGHIDFYSQRWFDYTGTTLEEMQGWGWEKVHDPAMLPKVSERWAHSLATGEPFEMEFPLRAADGTFQWFLTRVRPLRDTNGTILRWIGTNANIHAQREAIKRAEEANRTKDEFLATASHELRTPLNAILGWAHLLRSGQLDQSAFTRGLETIERNARAQVQLIEDILDGSRIITGKLHLEIRPLDMTALVRAALDAVRPAAEAKAIKLTMELDAAAARIVGDPERLQQVVWNLANNAVKFTPRGGTVQVSLARSGTSVELSVTDSGQGIAKDFLPFVFDRFRQAEGSTTRRHGGLGLGLALVRHLVEAHGGTVSADSEGEGRGARFAVLLPVQAVFQEQADSARPPLVAPVEAPGADQLGGLSGVSVLVVDDEADARELVATVLRASGAQVTLASSAAEALTSLSKQLPMVLVSDIGMPQVDGYQLIRRVRTSLGAKGAEMPAICSDCVLARAGPPLGPGGGLSNSRDQAHRAGRARACRRQPGSLRGEAVVPRASRGGARARGCVLEVREDLGHARRARGAEVPEQPHPASLHGHVSLRPPHAAQLGDGRLVHAERSHRRRRPAGRDLLLDRRHDAPQLHHRGHALGRPPARSPRAPNGDLLLRCALARRRWRAVRLAVPLRSRALRHSRGRNSADGSGGALADGRLGQGNAERVQGALTS